MTKTYRAEFFTTADFSDRDFTAETPEQALQMAREYYDNNLVELDFRSYQSCDADIDQIQIWDNERGTLATWESDDYRLRKAAPVLLAALQAQTEAAKAVIDNWEKGDLAAAVRALDASISTADAAIAKAVPAVDILPKSGSYTCFI